MGRTTSDKKAGAKASKTAKAAEKKSAKPKSTPVEKKARGKAAATKPAKATKPASVSKAKARPVKQSARAKAASRAKKAVAAKPPKQTVAPKGKAVAKAPVKETAKVAKKATTKAVAPVQNTPVVAAPASQKRSVARKKRVPKLDREFLVALCTAIRDAVTPAAQAIKGREVVGSAASGDATFELDRIAEKALVSFLRQAKESVAYYSEDAGYTTFTSGQPDHLLIVDPIDGTRAAKSGFEGCVISVGATSVIEQPVMADIESAMVMELLGNREFYAERGKGVRVYADGQPKRPKLSRNANLETISWSMTVPARPAELIFPTAARLIDLSSLKGGFFACNSTSFSLTRLLTNQLDACVDFANRYLRDIPDVVEDQFINAGRGATLGIAPYDFAAALLIVEEAGGVVTDAYGNTFDDVRLLDSSAANHQSIIAAANRPLYEKLMTFFDTRISQFETLLKRRAAMHV